MTVKCACGCQRAAPIAALTDRRHGAIKGQPRRFVSGHNRRGVKLSPEARAQISAVLTKPDAGYSATHKWMNRHHPRVGTCEECGVEGKTHWANLDHAYRRDREDWRELCPECHAQHDSAYMGGRHG